MPLHLVRIYLDTLSPSPHLRPLRHLPFTESAASGEMFGPSNGSECAQNCSVPCSNGTCPCACIKGVENDPSLGAAFASISYFFFLVATIQLILCMAHDALHNQKHYPQEWWRKAFRVNVQKSLLGAVVAATGTRAIYYTVQGYIEEKWADILLHVYYPVLLSAFSLLILFWAEIFYQSLPFENHVFLKKHKYSLMFFGFNAIVYLLLTVEVIITPLMHDNTEQVRKTGIIGIIFAILLFVMLVGFLHLAIRLFFRPDWQPLVLQLEALKINLKQHTLSCLGIVTNALMQALIIVLLIFNMVSHFKPVDNYSIYVSSIVIRVTELVMPVWFCCSLWNYKKPKSLWILNPGLLIQRLDIGGTERDPLVRSGDSSPAGYGSLDGSTPSSPDQKEEEEEEVICWVCQDEGNTHDLIQPCKCRLHHKCIQNWVMTRASNPNISRREVLKCQVCSEKYHTRKKTCVCFPQGLSRKHWIQGLSLLVFLMASALGSFYIIAYSPLSSSVKIAIVAVLVVIDLALLKLLGCGLIWLSRRHNAAIGQIVDRPTPPPSSSGQTGHSATPTRARRTHSEVGVVQFHSNHSVNAGALPDSDSGTVSGPDVRCASPTVSIQIAVDIHNT